MGRRRNNVLSDLLAIATALPWWVSIALAIGNFVVLRAVADGRISLAADPKELSGAMVGAMLLAVGKVGQWIVPLVFASGAALGLVSQRKARGLVDSAASADPRVPRTWREFEALVGEIYRRQGYRVAATPEGADGGVDLVFANDHGTFLVQCKQWQARLVDVKVVRELKGVIAATGAFGGAVVTSGSFTRAALDFGDKAGIDLVDGRRLEALARQLSDSASRESLVSDPAVMRSPRAAGESVQCPKCGADMVLRTAKRGAAAGQKFWGCSSYPNCKGTRQA